MTWENLRRIATSNLDWDIEYVRQGRRNFSDDDSFLIVGRHWNSDSPATPTQRTTPNADHFAGGAVGGGYFLQHNGFGIAIDPGYAFLRMLIERHNISLADIDAIVITHAHEDHLADIANFLNIARKCNVMPFIICSKPVQIRLSLLASEGVHDVRPGYSFSFRNPRNAQPVLTMQCLPSLHWQTISDSSFGLSGFMTFLDYHLSAFGIRFDLHQRHRRGGNPEKQELKSILITSDTMFPNARIINGVMGFYPQVYNNYLGSRKSYLHLGQVNMGNKHIFRRALWHYFFGFLLAYAGQNFDVLCLHIGSIEKRLSNPLPLHRVQYEGHHLGLVGIMRLLRLLDLSDTKIAVVTEWGEELLGERKNISKYLSSILNDEPFNKDIKCLPSDVDLKIDLRHGRIGCSNHNRLHKYDHMEAVEQQNEYIRYESYLDNPASGDFERTCNWEV